VSRQQQILHESEKPNANLNAASEKAHQLVIRHAQTSCDLYTDYSVKTFLPPPSPGELRRQVDLLQPDVGLSKVGMKLESLAYIFAAGSMGLSSFRFLSLAPKDVSFAQQSP